MSSRRNTIRTVACTAALALLCASSAGAAAPETTSQDPAHTAGLGVASVLMSVLYAPAKIVYATGGAVVGGLTWIFAGGNNEAAMGVLRPSMTGDYVLTPALLRDPSSIEFVGRSYERGADEIAAVSAPPPSSGRVCVGWNSVSFASNQAELDDAARQQLDRVARELERCPDQQVRIHGYTDATGELALNRQLSKRRARAVEAYLVEQGIDRSRLTATGRGTADPVSSNSTPEGRAANRRVEIALLSR